VGMAADGRAQRQKVGEEVRQQQRRRRRREGLALGERIRLLKQSGGLGREKWPVKAPLKFMCVCRRSFIEAAKLLNPKTDQEGN
jgi:hypothetical protein